MRQKAVALRQSRSFIYSPAFAFFSIDDIFWEEDRIVVMRSVVVHPPYSVDQVQQRDPNVTGSQIESTKQHVRKLVKNFAMLL